MHGRGGVEGVGGYRLGVAAEPSASARQRWPMMALTSYEVAPGCSYLTLW